MTSPNSARPDSFDLSQQIGMFGQNMIMDEQEIDMSTLNGEMMPWYLPHLPLPQDVLSFFDNGGNTGENMNSNVEMGNMTNNG